MPFAAQNEANYLILQGERARPPCYSSCMQRPSNFLLRYLRPRNYLLFISWKIKKIQILFHSMRLKYKFRNANQKSLFLDCGSNIGQGFEFFRKYYPLESFDFVLFEPNPYCFKILEQKYAHHYNNGVRLVRAAVASEDGKIDFYGLDETQGGVYSVGGSVLPEHNSRIYNSSHGSILKVKSINFSDFLTNSIDVSNYSVIILKLDIEGGEYQILDSLKEKNLLSLFETIYVEFHSQYMSPDKAREYFNKEREFLRYAKRKRLRVVQWI